MKTKIYLLFIFTVILTACTSKQKQQSAETVLIDSAASVSSFPEIEAGESFYKKQNPFGETIELTGKNITGDTAIFKPSECEMLVKGDFLVMKNFGQPLRVFNLPSLMQATTVGKWGSGPDEFLNPTLVPSIEKDNLCYVFENTNHKLYKLSSNGLLDYYATPFRTKEKRDQFGESRLISNISNNDFMYVGESPTGKSIFRITQQGDSVVTKEIFNLGLNPNRKSPFAYIGSFAVNATKRRMAYAYKYFKIIKFMDLDANVVHTVNFEREEFDENTLYKVDGLDQNVTHYWGACAQDDYVYFLYSGRTPVEVVNDGQKENYYIFVEQYDWNGKPIAKFRLDQWGYFTVDEKNKKIILVSTNHDEPFFVYQL